MLPTVFKFGDVEFAFTVNYFPDNGLPEIAVYCEDIGNNMVVFAFDRGGLTLCGDSVHLAVDGDEVYCETFPQVRESENPQPRFQECACGPGVPEQNRYSYVDPEKY